MKNQCNQVGPDGRCTRSWKRIFGANKTNCAQMGLSHLFKLPEQAPNMSHTDKDKDEDGDLTMEDKDTSNTSFKEASAGMTTKRKTRSSSQTTDTTSPVGSATDMVRLPSRHNNYQQMFEDGMAHIFDSDLNYIVACTTCSGQHFHTCTTYKDHDRSMIKAAALGGFPMAVATLLIPFSDPIVALAMYVKIEQETKGYHWAQFCLGVCYFYGLGTDEDHTTAVEWFTKASAQGNDVAMRHISAMHNLGMCYHEGWGCDPNETKAVECFTNASAQGHSSAMFNLGMYYHEGWGCVKNETIAFEWFEKSAQLGDKYAQDKLNLHRFLSDDDSVKCTNGHVLQPSTTTNGHLLQIQLNVVEGWGDCDKCGISVSDGDNVFSCRQPDEVPCNYVLCSNCYQQLHVANLQQSHTSKRKKPEASTTTSDSEDDLL